MPWINKPKKTERTTSERWDSRYYNKSRWVKLRASYLMYHPLCECENCKKAITPKLAEEVHHIKPFSTGRNDEERQELCYDYNNLMAVSKQCHIEIHKQMRKNRK